MSVTTFYETLGLAPSAAPEVIRAAYKALALICHPDKTLHLTAEDRASHAAVFNGVQAAYDVLGNPSLKAAYDAELACRSKKLKHSPPTPPPSEASSTPSRKTTVKMTTPEEKIAMRAKARESINHLRIKRAERDAQDAELDTAGLKDMVRTWDQLLNDNRDDPAMRAHCQIRLHEYENKVFEREQQHREWLAKLATAKTPPATRTHRASFTAPLSSSPVRSTRRAVERKHADAERIAAAAVRAEARAIEKAQREAARQAHLDKKAAAVRAEKDKLKAKADLIAQQDAERIAKARAKAGAAPRGTVGALVVGDHAPAMTGRPHNTVRMQPPTTKKYTACNGCDEGHDSFREWRKCNAQVKDMG
ncbi:hypothetical protein BDU57DRAFT_271593 [Ampelomyces quisqualis]|uniref:J domain-containing protein n=1 Tax=Ampelomyces quisqualis TaxID=50730 RepID=A0A6A5QJ33_AMPQU|nr:hypothetical protein BDU57DRAFT_271593 [Ampelomyces quisqualis]